MKYIFPVIGKIKIRSSTPPKFPRKTANNHLETSEESSSRIYPETTENLETNQNSDFTYDQTKFLKQNINKLDFLALIVDHLNLLRSDYNKQSKKHKIFAKTHEKFSKILQKLVYDTEHYFSLIDETNMDEMRLTYTLPNEDSKIIDELNLYACYGNELFEKMTNIKSLLPALSFEFDMQATELTLRIEQIKFSRFSESPTQV